MRVAFALPRFRVFSNSTFPSAARLDIPIRKPERRFQRRLALSGFDEANAPGSGVKQERSQAAAVE